MARYNFITRYGLRWHDTPLAARNESRRTLCDPSDERKAVSCHRSPYFCLRRTERLDYLFAAIFMMVPVFAEAALATNQSALILPPPSRAATNDLRAVKPPVEIPAEWAWLWWTLLGLAILAALVWWWRRSQKKLVAPPATPAPLPHVLAKQRLQAALSFIHDPREFCIRVSDALRTYLEDRFHFHAPDRTTEEFMQELHGTHLLTFDQRASLEQFLQSCDLVKFARHEPTEATLRDLYESALRLVDETQYERVQLEPAPA